MAHPLIGGTREVALQLNLLSLCLPIHHLLPILWTELVVILSYNIINGQLSCAKADPKILILDIGSRAQVPHNSPGDRKIYVTKGLAIPCFANLLKGRRIHRLLKDRRLNLCPNFLGDHGKKCGDCLKATSSIG